MLEGSETTGQLGPVGGWPARDQYASANQGAGTGKARSFLCSVFLLEKIDKQIGLRILDIEKGVISLFTK